jgi:pyridoxamine 5'-phosphate oxidase
MNNVHTSDPLEQFNAWYAEAGTDVVALATATPDGAPSARMVLLKGADTDGFTFFTNYESRKGRELADNPRAALLFHWPGRQIRIEGAVVRISEEESDAYFATRPKDSQIAAWVSPQSDVIDSRMKLERIVTRNSHSSPVPRPPHWGGYRLVPHTYEFWEHRASRLHDRIRFRLDADRWIKERLAP